MRIPVSFKLQEEILNGLDEIAKRLGQGSKEKPNRTAAISFLVTQELAKSGDKNSGKNSKKTSK